MNQTYSLLHNICILAPTAAPGNVHSNCSRSTNSLFILWTPIDEEHAQGDLRGYILSLQLLTLGYKEIIDGPMQHIDVHPSASSVEIKHLQYSAKYKVTIYGYNDVGQGVVSEPLYAG